MNFHFLRFSSFLRLGEHCFSRSDGVRCLCSLSLRRKSPSVVRYRSAAILCKLEKCNVTFPRGFSMAARLLNCSSFSAEQEIIVRGDGVPKPCLDFRDSNLDEHILQELHRLGFERPTRIQSQCLPVALGGRDVVGIGQTGSGKTLAYILPALVHVAKQKQHDDDPTVLVLAPTRELAQQIEGVLSKFRVVCGIRSVCLFGGVSKGPQMKALANGVNVCIATPGRLIDLNEMGAVRLSQVSYLVLDEADRMLDMGFEPQIRRIVDRLGRDHQTLMWSATWPPEVQVLAMDFLKDSVHITVGSTELMANPNITQNIHVCDQMEKPDKLYSLLEEILSKRKSKVLIFAETKVQVDVLTRNLVWKKIPTSSLHGDRSQLQRDKAVHDFRSGRTSVLIATDVAARGLDITDISHVINYDFPRVTDTYVHRIGRTARADRKGTAHSFFTVESRSQARELVDVLTTCKQAVDPELLEMARTSGSQKRSSSLSYFGGHDKNKDNFFKKSVSGQRNNFRRRSSFDGSTESRRLRYYQD